MLLDPHFLEPFRTVFSESLRLYGTGQVTVKNQQGRPAGWSVVDPADIFERLSEGGAIVGSDFRAIVDRFPGFDADSFGFCDFQNRRDRGFPAISSLFRKPR